MKVQTNILPVDAPYNNGIIHYFNIIDRGERPQNLLEVENWERYEAEYEITGTLPDTEVKKEYEPKFILCSTADYFRLNKQLSELKGYAIGNNTERCKEMNPKACKVNIQYDNKGNETGYEAKLVFPVTSEEQGNYPELFAGFELVSNYIPVEAPLDFIDILDLDEPTMLWIAEHCIRIHVTFDGIVLTLPISLHSGLTGEMIQAINDLGVTLIFE